MDRIILKISNRFLTIILITVFMKLYIAFRADVGIIRSLASLFVVGFSVQFLWLINHDIICIFEKIRKHRENNYDQ